MFVPLHQTSGHLFLLANRILSEVLIPLVKFLIKFLKSCYQLLLSYFCTSGVAYHSYYYSYIFDISVIQVIASKTAMLEIYEMNSDE